ncbi:MAG: bifunctional serine/threonine-protein kinase/formylglycine-generating enzyme family protein [Anaerolineales bacterium]
MTTLGKYELFEKLGEGATADVYHARDTAMGREVSLKVLKPALVADTNAFERFTQEAQAAAGLFHPNIATALDMGETGGRYFIAMRYFPGQSLDKVLKAGPLSWPETLRLAQQIGAALDYAHGQGFLHRDVKPSNIIRAQDGSFILTDFGLTRAMMRTGLTSHTGAVLGTPAYIAPEIWHGKPAVPATDQYALACVLCEALTGQTLFAGDTPPAVMTQHVLQGPQLPKAWPSGVPAGIDAILRRALSAKPEDRYASMADLNAALLKPKQATAATAHPPVKHPSMKTPPPQTVPPAPAPKVEEKPKSSAWVWVTLGIMVVCLVVGAASGGLGWLLNQPATAPITVTSAPSDTPAESVPTPAPSDAPTESVPTAAPTLTSAPIEPPAPGPTPTPPVSKDGMELVFVPAGTFTMGSNNDKADEKPAHTVYLDAFWIDKTEVTNAMYTRCVQAGGCDLPHNILNYLNSLYADHPVGYIAWKDAQNYCVWAGRRLPSEAEWEKAARGADGRIYPWGNQPSDHSVTVLNYYYSHINGTTAVGKYPNGASPYGALDMAGNVWEWVADWYDSIYYQRSPASNPTGPSSGMERVLRGGSWYNDDASVRAAIRRNLPPESALGSNGFRCALSSH